MKHFLRNGRRGTVLGAMVATLGASLAGCSTDRLLEAEDPDLVGAGDLQSADGAEALRIGAMGRLSTALMAADASQDGMWLQGGLLVDEWKSSNTFTQTNEIDSRVVRDDNSSVEGTYRNVGRARNAALIALKALRANKPTATTAAAQMFFVKGFLELQSAETYCSGLSFSDASDLAFRDPASSDEPNYGARLTTVEALETALASFDSALAAAGTASDAATVRKAAQVGRGRALLGLGRFAEAGAAVSGVDTPFAWNITFSPTTSDNPIWGMNNNQKRYTVGDTADAKNAMPFVAAKDARVPTVRTSNGFDTTVPHWTQLIWSARDSSVAIARGLDARLIEAEAALKAGNYVQTLTIVNGLRASAGLGPIVDPVTPKARALQFFREKAFFQYGRGHRLGDLRRMVRHYGFAQDEVFPVGAFYRGGNYGTDMNLPVPRNESNNPNYRGTDGEFLGCFDRNA